MKIIVQGVEETNLKLSQILAAVQENVDNTLDLFSADMTKEIKDSAPYDTGRYMSSWFYERQAIKYAIISQNFTFLTIYILCLAQKNSNRLPMNHIQISDSERGIIHDVRQIKFIYSIKLGQLIKRVNLLNANISLAGYNGYRWCFKEIAEFIEEKIPELDSKGYYHLS